MPYGVFGVISETATIMMVERSVAITAAFIPRDNRRDSRLKLAKTDKILSEKDDRILLFTEIKYNIVRGIQKTEEKYETVL